MYGDSVSGGFNEFVEQKGLDRELKTWLLQGFQESNFAPFRLSLEPSAPIQLQYAFEELSYESKKLFEEATIEATKGWNYPTYNPETLKQLVLLAAYIEADGIISVLEEIIESEKLEELKGKELDDGITDAYTYTMRYIVGVLQGFAPRTEAKEVLEKLFFSDRFDRFTAQFAAQLFLGLCECAPEAYAGYVSRFLELEYDNPGHYSMFHVIRGLARIVPPETRKKYLEDLDPRWDDDFFDLLCDRDWSPAKEDAKEYISIMFQSRLPARAAIKRDCVEETEKVLASMSA